jgi:hypothetical protein
MEELDGFPLKPNTFKVGEFRVGDDDAAGHVSSLTAGAQYDAN